jgi:hypothetical protein
VAVIYGTKGLTLPALLAPVGALLKPNPFHGSSKLVRPKALSKFQDEMQLANTTPQAIRLQNGELISSYCHYEFS